MVISTAMTYYREDSPELVSHLTKSKTGCLLTHKKTKIYANVIWFLFRCKGRREQCHTDSCVLESAVHQCAEETGWPVGWIPLTAAVAV